MTVTDDLIRLLLDGMAGAICESSACAG